MRNGRLHTDADQSVGIVDRQPSVCRELGAAAIVGVAEVAHIQLGTCGHQYPDRFRSALVGSAMQSDAARISLKVGVDAQRQQILDGSHGLIGGALFSHAFYPADTCGHRQRCHAQLGVDLGICSTGDQQLEQGQIAGLSSTQEGCSALFVQPLVGEDRTRFGALGDARIDVGTLVEQEGDVVEAIEIGLAGRVVAALDVAVVGGQV